MRKFKGGLIFKDSKLFRAAPILETPEPFDCPQSIDNSAYCTPLENQGREPWCAAYSMNQLLQASYWREFHSKVDFPEDKTYARAKRIDRIDGDGTTLEAVMRAVNGQNVGLKVRPYLAYERINGVTDLLFSIHKYGIVMLGLNITQGWMNLKPYGTIGDDDTPVGGHAVLASTYNLKGERLRGPNWWGPKWGVSGGFWDASFEQVRKQLMYGYAIRITWR